MLQEFWQHLSHNLQRITLIADESLEKQVVDQAIRLGAESYICCFCSGKPLHTVVESPSETGSLVRIELLAQDRAAQDILAYLRQLQKRNYALTAVVDSVAALP